MDTFDFARRNRLIIVAGKGGVGKTTVSAALATIAARAGLRVVLAAVDSAAGLLGLVDRGPGDPPLGYEPVRVITDPSGGWVDVRVITSDQALLEWLGAKGLRRLAGRLASTGTLDVISTAAPGIEDILVLGRIKALVNEGAQDLIVLDAPASGHAITFLQSASGLVDAAAVGAIREQAAAVQELLRDHDRCEVVSVTLAEETPVSELLETTDLLEDRVGLALGPVVVNQLLPAVGVTSREEARILRTAGVDAATGAAVTAALAHRRTRVAGQQRQLDRLAAALPLRQLHLPALPTVGLTGIDRERLADALTDALSDAAARP